MIEQNLTIFLRLALPNTTKIAQTSVFTFGTPETKSCFTAGKRGLIWKTGEDIVSNSKLCPIVFAFGAQTGYIVVLGKIPRDVDRAMFIFYIKGHLVG